MKSLFEQHKVLICAGSGGVGKTTMSAAIGVAAAQAGLKVIVLTIDPARRLASALGLEGGLEETRVPGQNFKGELWASMIEADEIFKSFIEEAMNDKETLSRLLKNKLYQQLSTTLSGSQEFTSLVKLSDCVNSGKYDLVILDTPPTQHAIDFLKAPEKIYALFQDSITKWFIEEDDNPGFFQRIINRGTRTVFKAFESITGTQFITELSEFFECVRSIQGTISQKSVDAQNLLLDDKTGFVLVTGFDEVKLQEANFFNQELKRGGFKLTSVIVNRCFPFWLENESGQRNEMSPELQQLYEQFIKYHQTRLDSYKRFEEPLKGKVAVVRMPDMNKDINGIKNLDELAGELTRRFPK